MLKFDGWDEKLKLESESTVDATSHRYTMREFSIICPHYKRHNLGRANCHGFIKSRNRRRTRERDSEFELEIMAAATSPFSARLRAANPLATRHLNSLALVSKPKFLISVSRAAPLHTRFGGARLPSLLPVIRAQSSPGTP